MITDINNEDRLVQKTFADYLRDRLGWESVYTYNSEVFGASRNSPTIPFPPLPSGEGRGEGNICDLGRASEREVVLIRDLRSALRRLNPDLPDSAREEALSKLTTVDFSRSLLQHNREFYRFIRDGVPVSWRGQDGETRHGQARVIDFMNGSSNGFPNNRFLIVRELKIQGLRVPHYNRRADLVCFVNGLPLVFFELKAVYRNIRAGFDQNLSDYLHESSICHAFHHNAFLVVSNGDRARYGSITAKWEHFVEWKRNDESERGGTDAKIMLDGMFAHDRLLDLVANFLLFDESRPGGVRKIVARNHQVLGVNNAVASVARQEELKRQFPERRKRRPAYDTGSVHRTLEMPDPKPLKSLPMAADSAKILSSPAEDTSLFSPIVERAHPDLGRLGVFWHTQGSGKSYSMAFFAEKVRRTIPGSFTFLVMTDREDLDSQIFRTFVGCGVADAKTKRAGSGRELEKLLGENHRFIFTLIQKFRRDQPPRKPYSRRDDIIVLSDEAHRTQAGKLARNMRVALPNASFIGFTGTPLFKQDHLTRRIFGPYVSRYDFKRSEEDNSTVRLVYENRGEKLEIAKPELNDRIAQKIEEAELQPDQMALLERLLGRDYEIITADDRLDKIADDFVEHCSARWESGKSMLVCIDKITCARMHQRILPRWHSKIIHLTATAASKGIELQTITDDEIRDRLNRELKALKNRIRWMENTLIHIIISEGQNEARDFARWGFHISPHRDLIKRGFDRSDQDALPVEDAFKDPDHPFRVAIVCAMWLTGFDVECLSTLYIDKPMKAHTLMQAIARANRVYPGKDCGVIVDYNGMLKSLREALAQWALGDEYGSDGEVEVVEPIEARLKALLQAIDEAEKHLQRLGFDPARLMDALGFDRIEMLRDAVEVLYRSDEDKRRFEIMARLVFSRFKALITEPSIDQYAERHDNIEAIYRKLTENRDTADVTELLKELHRIVNESIRTSGTGADRAEGLTVDLSRIDFARLRDEFEKKIRRKNTALQDLRSLVEKMLLDMMSRNPTRMDYYRKYQEIISEYNREKDRATVEETFARLTSLFESLNEEQKRAARENLDEDELAFFDLMVKTNLGKAEREKLKQASRSLLASLKHHLDSIPLWTRNAQTQAEVEVFILDRLHETLPIPPFTPDETQALSHKVYEYVWQRSMEGTLFAPSTAA